MLAGGASIVTVQKILGHLSIQMTMRYVHDTPEDERRAVEKLSGVFKETRKHPVSVEIKRPASYLKTHN
jgi:integrase